VTWSNPHNIALLGRLQQGVPLRREPFAAIAAELGLDGADVLDRLRHWRKEGILREVSALFDASATGYETALIAQQLAGEELTSAAERAASHPGVSHCYLREGRYNLWFTLAVSPMSRPGLEGTADRLARLAGDAPTLVLPSLKKYKLRVHLPAVEAADDPTPAPPPSCPSPRVPDRRERSAIRLLQTPMPLTRAPWRELVAASEWAVDDLLAEAERLGQLGWLRRVSGLIRHTLAGARANLLAAWDVDEDRIDEVGQSAARISAVSHCYRRPGGPDWPYTLYTMIHGRGEEDVRSVIRRIGKEPGVRSCAELPTVREVKKQRVKLFTAEEANWEARHMPDR
jgi:DNA-binding Lrp family transcriptional regulator